MNILDRFADPRFVISLLVLCIFGWAYGENVSDETMKGAVISALNIAIGFWLGSSRGTTESNERTNKALDIAASAQAGPTGNPTDPISVTETRP